MECAAPVAMGRGPQLATLYFMVTAQAQDIKGQVSSLSEQFLLGSKTRSHWMVFGLLLQTFGKQ